MRFGGVIKLVSTVIIFIGIAMLFCNILSFIYKENPFPLLIGGWSAILFGSGAYFFTRKENIDNLDVKDGCAIVTFSWLGACFFGALPFYTMGFFNHEIAISWTKSFYEIMSGFTTTGSSIFTDVEILPKDILFWRSLSHWFGGMGIVIFAIAVLPKIGVGGMQAFRMESPGPIKTDKLVPRIGSTAKILYIVYLGVTLVMITLLLLVGVKLFDSLVFTFGTVGTGGFAIYNNSVSGLQNPIAEYIIAFFMWLSGVNFGLTFLLVWERDWRTFFKDVEFQTYTSITIISTVLITLVLFLFQHKSLNLEESFRLAFFQVTTVLTTTGYATTDYNLWPLSAIGVLIFLMFIGGSTGSTGGGIKVLRHIINFKFIKQEILRVANPALVTSVKVGGRYIENSIVSSVIIFSTLYLMLFFICGLILIPFSPDIITAFTASIANLGNIGPGLSAVGPVANYAFYHPFALWVLTFEMLAGRLELFTVFVLFSPSVWRRRNFS